MYAIIEVVGRIFLAAANSIARPDYDILAALEVI